MRIRNLIIVGCLTVFAGGVAQAGEGATKEENIGVGTGVVIGAAAGGPAGAIVGAAIGATLGDLFHKRGEEVAGLSEELGASRAALSKTERDLDRLARDKRAISEDLSKLQAMARPELIALLQAGIEMDLLFRTDEHDLGDTVDERLRAMAASLAAMPDVRIRLDGYSDERGDEGYNQQLSQRRAEYVRDVLIGGGIDARRIQVSAHGESPARDTSVDSYALERRVSLTLLLDGTPSFASTPAK